MTTASTSTKRSWGDRILTRIEIAGNKLPEPFALFLWLILITGVISTAMAWSGVEVQCPAPTRGRSSSEACSPAKGSSG